MLTILGLALVAGLSQAAPLESGMACEVCELAGTEVRSLLENNETMNTICQGIKKACALMPGFVGAECASLVDEYGPYYLRLALEQLDFTSLCTKLGLCDPKVQQQLSNVIETIATSVDEGDGCKACKAGMHEIKTILQSDDTLALVHIAVHEVCGLIKVFPSCEAILNTAVDEAVQALLPMFDPDAVCKQIGACPANEIEAFEHQTLEEEFGIVPQLTGDSQPTMCEACTEILNGVKNTAGTGETAEKVENITMQLCGYIDIPFCEMIVRPFLTERLKDLKNLDVDATCKMIHACPVISSSSNSVESFGDTCSECTMVADLLLGALKSEEVQTILEEGVDQICNVVPIPDCKETINGMFAYLMDMIGNLDGKTVCGWIGLCSGKTVQEPLQLGTVCDECTELTGMLLQTLQDPAVWAEVEREADAICSMVPVSGCEDLVKTYVTMAKNMIKDLDAKELCGYFGLCGANKKVIEKVKLGSVCEECTTITDMLLSAVKDPSVWAQVEAEAEAICSVVPVSGCEDMVRTYVMMAKNMIESLDGKTLCGYFGLCTSNCQVTVEGLCADCTMVADQILMVVKTQAGLAKGAIKMAVHELCSICPDKNCEATMDKFVDMLFDRIDGMTGKDLCSLIGLCQSRINSPPVKVSFGFCEECTNIMNQVLLILKSQVHMLKPEVKEVGHYICMLFNETYEMKNCESVFNSMIDDVFGLIENSNIDGKTVCSFVGACGGSQPTYF